MEAVHLQRVCRVLEAELFSAENCLFFRRDFYCKLRSCKGCKKNRCEVRNCHSCLILFFHLMYLFTSTAISQSMPYHRKGSFHASILDLFSSPSCRLPEAEWNHFLNAEVFPSGMGTPTCWWMGRQGRARLCSGPFRGTGCSYLTWTIPHSRTDKSFCLGTSVTWSGQFLSHKKELPVFRQRCQQANAFG